MFKLRAARETRERGYAERADQKRIEDDNAQALKWHLKAVELFEALEGKPIYRVDHAGLLHKVAEDYSRSENDDDKLKWYRRAAALGDQEAAEQVRDFDARTTKTPHRARASTRTHSYTPTTDHRTAYRIPHTAFHTLQHCTPRNRSASSR